MGISRDLIATSVTPLLLSWLAQGSGMVAASSKRLGGKGRRTGAGERTAPWPSHRAGHRL